MMASGKIFLLDFKGPFVKWKFFRQELTDAIGRNFDSLFEFRSTINEVCSLSLFQQTTYCIFACLYRIFASSASKTLSG
jgi:hypothetical protein